MPSLRLLTRFQTLARYCCYACCLLFAVPASAVDVQYSGFASLVAGRTFGTCVTDSTMSSSYNSHCTRFIADWAHGGVYSPSLSLKPESKLGLQGKVNFLNNLSATVQMVSRLADGTAADLEWAYLTYDVNPTWTVQLGRKRLPLYFYSTAQDVGYAYPWVRLPADIYGWDAVNYNGGSLTFRTQLRDWSLQSNVFGGDERTDHSAYAKLSYDDPKDIQWRNIRGADLELSRDWLTARVTYIVSDYEQFDRNSAAPDVLPSQQTIGKQKIYGGSVNVDTDRWLMRSEYSIFDRSRFQYKATAWMLGAGIHLGKFTPMLTTSGYHERTRFPDHYTQLSWATQSVSVRYEVGNASALKLQVDRLDDGPNTFAGNARALTLSYDVIF
jgi:hypothetical protein